MHFRIWRIGFRKQIPKNNANSFVLCTDPKPSKHDTVHAVCSYTCTDVHTYVEDIAIFGTQLTAHRIYIMLVWLWVSVNTRPIQAV